MIQKIDFHNRSLIIADEIMEEVITSAIRACRVRSPILIAGESGTGKELVARVIHARSENTGPFQAVNCAAVPEGLMEAEFFGYERGAFTGAIERRLGKFEMAQGGSLLLDEVSEMPLYLQAKLLRVLQEHEVERLGGKGPITVDVRVIATTNRSPELLVNEGLFRKDLFYRLNVIRIECPSLRGRKKAIGVLAREFLKTASLNHGFCDLSFSDAAMDRLIRYSWPGNVRELTNAIERVVINSSGNLIDSADLYFLEQSEVVPAGMANGSSSGTLDDWEKKHILAMLSETGGNRTEAARKLGITSRTLRNKLRVFQVA